jgi:hypothetical protein
VLSERSHFRAASHLRVEFDDAYDRWNESQRHGCRLNALRRLIVVWTDDDGYRHCQQELHDLGKEVIATRPDTHLGLELTDQSRHPLPTRPDTVLGLVSTSCQAVASQ